jgi:hypothetical protein
MIRVLIAGDMHMIRGALVALLSPEDGMEPSPSWNAATRSWTPRCAPGPTSQSWISTCQGWTA